MKRGKRNFWKGRKGLTLPSFTMGLIYALASLAVILGIFIAFKGGVQGAYDFIKLKWGWR